MDISKVQPDDSHVLQAHINQRQVNVTFRYFSPSRIHHSNYSSSKNKMSIEPQNSQVKSAAPPLDEEPDVSAIGEFGEKVVLAPQRQSDKFYQDKIAEANRLLIEDYETFHHKLLHKVSDIKAESKIRIKLTPSSKQKGKPANKVKSRQKPYLKVVQIDLLKKNKENVNEPAVRESRKRKPIFARSAGRENTISAPHSLSMEQNPARHKKYPKRLVLKLFDNQSKKSQVKNPEEQAGYETPRNHSRKRKGIHVYSSQSHKNRQASLSLDKHLNESTLVKSNIVVGPSSQIRESHQPKHTIILSKKRRSTYGSGLRQDSEGSSHRRMCSRERLSRKRQPTPYKEKMSTDEQ